MKLNSLFETESKIIGQSGQMRLRSRHWRWTLVSGSREDQTELKEIVSLFLHDVVLDLHGGSRFERPYRSSLKNSTGSVWALVESVKKRLGVVSHVTSASSRMANL